MLERLLFRNVAVWQAVIATFLTILTLVAWSAAVAQYQVFPYGLLKDLRAFVRGDTDDPRSIVERLRAELTYDPSAFPSTSTVELIGTDRLSTVRSKPNPGGVVPDLGGMRYFSATNHKRYFVLFGSFAFPDRKTHWGAIALDSEGVVHRGWAIRPERYEYLGGNIGLAVTGAGLVATNAHGVLTGYGWCGEKRWEAPWQPNADGQRREMNAADAYDWHHDITARDGLLYTFRGAPVAAVDARSGDIVSEIHILDLMRWGRRDGLSLFDSRRTRRFEASALTKETLGNSFVENPFHFNKVDVLGKELADRYPQFEAGDLLMSLRELDLVVVARPSTQRIVWWRSGLSSAQHDASFVDGYIELFDNNPTSDPPRPRILRLDLDAQRAETVFDLSQWKMEMRLLGNFERQGEQLLTLDSFAGRFISGRLDGEIDFLFENGWRAQDGKIINLQLMNGTEIDADAFNAFEMSCQK